MSETFDIINAICSGCDEIQPCKLVPVNEGAWWELACSSCMEETGIDKDACFAEITITMDAPQGGESNEHH